MHLPIGYDPFSGLWPIYLVMVAGRSDGQHDAAGEQWAADLDECDIQPPLTGSLPHSSAAALGHRMPGSRDQAQMAAKRSFHPVFP